MANLSHLPRWVRLWYAVPLVDRYAYSWMWHHGGWLLQQSAPPSAPPGAGVREPRSPTPPSPILLTTAVEFLTE